MSKMEAPEHDLSKLTVAQRKLLEEYERRIKDASAALQQEAPEHVKELGDIIRKSVANKSLVKFKRFLRKHEIDIGTRDLEAFRDHLIIHRIDLKDLEPEARARIFLMAHAKEDSSKMTEDYRAEIRINSHPSCRDCRWFVTAPNDSDDNAEKSCVEMGTKGADRACYGFTYPSN
jgi:hypothetical protein